MYFTTADNNIKEQMGAVLEVSESVPINHIVTDIAGTLQRLSTLGAELRAGVLSKEDEYEVNSSFSLNCFLIR